MKKAWLASHTWETVIAINAMLCGAKNAFHGPTSDGYDEAHALWESEYSREMSLKDAVELCRRCHKIAPFCFFNGNTFAAIIKMAFQSLPGLGFAEKGILQSIGAHIVAGTSTPEEDIQFKKLLEKIT